jgi:hypothetical protein
MGGTGKTIKIGDLGQLQGKVKELHKALNQVVTDIDRGVGGEKGYLTRTVIRTAVPAAGAIGGYAAGGPAGAAMGLASAEAITELALRHNVIKYKLAQVIDAARKLGLKPKDVSEIVPEGPEPTPQNTPPPQSPQGSVPATRGSSPRGGPVGSAEVVPDATATPTQAVVKAVPQFRTTNEAYAFGEKGITDAQKETMIERWHENKQLATKTSDMNEKVQLATQNQYIREALEKAGYEFDQKTGEAILKKRPSAN